MTPNRRFSVVAFAGEFGRRPYAQIAAGRDHNHTGCEGVVDPVHIHDWHETILHLLEHENLSCRYAGRDFRLTDVHGRVVREILV